MTLSCRMLLSALAVCLAAASKTQAAARYESQPNVAVPDYPAQGYSDTLIAPEGYVVGDLDVELAILHYWIGDISVTLSHDAIIVVLVDRPGVPATAFGCFRDDYGLVLDDEGSGGPIEALCTANMVSPPNYTPNEPLSAFEGSAAGGAWTLTVTDHAGSQAYPTLVSWALSITPPGCTDCLLYADLREPLCVVDVDDLLAVIEGFADPETYPEADIAPCGGDGVIDVDDLLAALNAFFGSFACLHPCPA